MKINREEHPAVKVGVDQDGVVHLFDSTGTAWCEDEDAHMDGTVSEDDADDMCGGCVRAGQAEGVFL